MTGYPETMKARILIVEDEALIALDLQRRLQNWGYTVLGQAFSAEKALELIEQEPPDLVLMDIVLQGKMDGIEAADLIRSRWAIPVVFSTAYADQKKLERAKLTHPFGFLMKPYQDRDIEVTIEMALYVSKVDGERRKVEEALRESNFYLKKAQESLEIGYFSYDPVTTMVTGSSELLYMFDVDPDQPLFEAFASAVHPEDGDLIFPFIDKTLREGIPYDVEHRIRRKDGTVLFVRAKGEMVSTLRGKRLVGIVQDISARKRAEEALQKSQTLLRDTERISKIGGWEYDVQTGRATFTDGIFKIYGKTFSDPEEGVQGYHPDDRIIVWQAFQKAITEKEPYDLEVRLTNAQGTNLWVRTIGEPVIEDGRVVKIVGNLMDVTDRKREEDLKQERDRLNQTLLDSLPCVALLLRPKTREIIAMNKAARDAGCLLGRTCFETWAKFEKSCPWCLAPQLWAEGRSQQSEVEALGVVWEAHWEPISDDQYLHYAFDITERKQAEEKMRESEERYRQLVELSPEAVVVHCQGQVVYINTAGVQIFGGSGPEELVGKPIKNFVHPDYWEKVVERIRLMQEENRPALPAELIFLRLDGQPLEVETRGVPIRYQGKRASLSLINDITERKQREAQLHAALKTKEVLLRELYHRTKNNMQVISSLLRLQREQIREDSVSGAFLEMENRIQAMALVHRKLYQSQDLSFLDLGEYCRELVALVKEGYRVSPEKVAVILETEEIKSSIDAAIPCGLILTELISNAFKYAFPGERKGEIRIGLKKVDGGLLELRVSDNGVGIRPDFDFRNNSKLGIQIVLTLGENQLGGKVHFETDPGLTCRVLFQEPDLRQVKG